MHLFLTGFMGSGKSTVGKALAERSGLPFIDSDEWIEGRAGKTVSDIFEEEGESHFRELEATFIHRLPAAPHIIACGGGLPCFNNLMKEMKGLGTVVYLEGSLDTLVERLKSERSERPLLRNLDDMELRNSIRERLSARAGIYQQATVSIAIDGKTVAEIVAELESIRRS